MPQVFPCRCAECVNLLFHANLSTNYTERADVVQYLSSIDVSWLLKI